ncbi:hypothetical protein BKA69DRAFT_1124579 [Paraphysoderma sedebokerense]|nr:hypothetical protein BKA69DRAFT_1124579 [Paraphysoderma sedebokerense]
MVKAYTIPQESHLSIPNIFIRAAGEEIAQNASLAIPKFPSKPKYAVGDEVSSRLKVFAPKAVMNAQGGVDVVIAKTANGEGGASLVSETSIKTGTFCATISLPSDNYGGVAMTFYGLSRNSPSNNLGQDDEQDFEFKGNTGRMQTNIFKNGKQQPVEHKFAPKGTYKMCLVNTGKEVKYFVNDKELTQSRKPVGLTKDIFAWFSIWLTNTGWPNCCGKAEATQWIQTIDNFSVYKAS